MTQVQWKYIYI